MLKYVSVTCKYKQFCYLKNRNAVAKFNNFVKLAFSFEYIYMNDSRLLITKQIDFYKCLCLKYLSNRYMSGFFNTNIIIVDIFDSIDDILSKGNQRSYSLITT